MFKGRPNIKQEIFRNCFRANSFKQSSATTRRTITAESSSDTAGCRRCSSSSSCLLFLWIFPLRLRAKQLPVSCKQCLWVKFDMLVIYVRVWNDLSRTWNFIRYGSCSGSQTFMVCGPLPKTRNTCGPCSPIKTFSFVWRYAISQQSYLVKASARGPRRTAP